MFVPLANDTGGRLGSSIEEGGVGGTTDDCTGEGLGEYSVALDCRVSRFKFCT
jgi:hypothetical protein